MNEYKIKEQVVKSLGLLSFWKLKNILEYFGLHNRGERIIYTQLDFHQPKLTWYQSTGSET